MTTQKIILPLRTKIGTGKYGVIYIPTEYRDLFPPYKKSFTIQTDNGEISPWMTGKSRVFPDGCNIIGGGLLDWFRKQNLTIDDSLEIEILQLKKKYRLTIVKSQDENVEDETADIISKTEGGERVVVSRQAERNPKLRKDAIKIHGLVCKGCGFDFEKTYSEWGQGFIEVHHIHPLGQTINIIVETDPKKDMTVLCSNCHRMVHRKRETTLTIEELKGKIKNGT